MKAELVVRNGGSRGKVLTLAEGSHVIVGRSSSAHFQLRDEGVSRNHCLIENQQDRIVVTDMGSTNGTLVNSARVRSGYLRQGDLLQLGNVMVDVLVVARERPDPAGAPDTLGDPEHTLLIPASEAVAKAVDQDSLHALRNLKALYHISSALAGEGDPHELFDRVSVEILKVIPADRVALHLCTSSGALEQVGIRVTDPAATGGIRVSQRIIARVVSEGLSSLSHDATRDERYQADPTVSAQHIRSVMCVPLKGKSNVLGVLYADTCTQVQAFDVEHLEFLSAIGHQAGPALERAQLIDSLEKLFIGAVRTLVAAVDAKDSYTHGHSERVTAYALAMADLLGLDGETREIVELAGLLHDVGKIGVPEAVLNKKGCLDEREFATIKLHPAKGCSIIANINHRYIHEVAQAVRAHHERWDGNGYPDGLCGERTPLIARILTVADAYDAMASNRPYRTAFSHGETIRRLRECAGSQFDPKLVTAFLQLDASGLLQATASPLKYTATLGVVDAIRPLPPGVDMDPDEAVDDDPTIPFLL